MIEIIPATDIIGGQCVRLTQGDYASRKTYYRDPLEAAFRFEEAPITTGFSGRREAEIFFFFYLKHQ